MKLKLTDIPVRLLTQYRPQPAIITTRSRKNPEGKTRVAALGATPLRRIVTDKGGVKSPASLLDLVATAVVAYGLNVPHDADKGQTPAEAIFEMAASEGLIVIKRDDKGIMRGAWLSSDFPLKKRRDKTLTAALAALAARDALRAAGIDADAVFGDDDDDDADDEPTESAADRQAEDDADALAVSAAMPELGADEFARMLADTPKR